MSVNAAAAAGGIDSLETCKLLFHGPVQNESAAILLRSRLNSIGRRLKFSDVQRENMALAASEMASNQIKHAAGRGMLQIWQQPGPALDLVALDFGPGIHNLALAQEDGYSTTHTLGKGLGSLQRLSNASGVYSLPESATGDGIWHGTLFWTRFHLHRQPEHTASTARRTTALPEIGLFSRAVADDRFNGDRIYLQRQGNRLRWLHLDGLGHGEKAQSATGSLGSSLFQSEDLPQVLALVNRQLSGTRGAVGIVAEADLLANSARFAGVGDMSAYLMLQEKMQIIAFSPGILGREHKTPTVTTVPFEKKCIILTASDGIRRSWNSESFPGLFNQHPQIIAYLLGNIMGRVSDDQSICAVRIG